MLKNMNASCLKRSERIDPESKKTIIEKEIVLFWIDVQESTYQFQMVSISKGEDKLRIKREFFDIDGTCSCKPFTVSSKGNIQVYNAWAYLKGKSKAFEPQVQGGPKILIPKNGILLGGDEKPDNLIALYEPEGVMQWNLDFGPYTSAEVVIRVNGMNQTSGKVHNEFVQALRDASKNNYDDVRKNFDSMLEEAKVKRRG